MQGAHGSRSCNWRASRVPTQGVAFRLQIARAEERVGRRGRIAVVLILTVFTVAFGAGRLVGHATRHPEPHGSRIAAATALPADDDSVIDAFGNEVTEAVASYKLDSKGTIYEEHSPQ